MLRRIALIMSVSRYKFSITVTYCTINRIMFYYNFISILFLSGCDRIYTYMNLGIIVHEIIFYTANDFPDYYNCI